MLHAYLLFFSDVAEKKPEPQEQKVKYNGNVGREDKPKDIWVSSGQRECDSYEGMGIVYSFMTNVVIKVASDGPADKAGIKAGDVIITPIDTMTFKFGQTVYISLQRGNSKIKVKVLIDRICQE